ncbi:MAG TPA: phytanoyl-CoA dioxygenase family protein [Thermoanaerobaculia bacterium]|nr:phytanoyl-CoA dioxygenase family protein [Thermoanaerobaculia bacterium]
MDDLDTLGYGVADVALSHEQCDHLAASLPMVGRGHGGVRSLLFHPSVLRFLRHNGLGNYLWSVTGRDLVAVKATLFDKTGESNWRMQWHQDRVVAIRERMNVAGYRAWSTKAGVLHVEPPASVLAQMLAVRLHLDDCGPDNGPLRVIPGSHELGTLSDQQLRDCVTTGDATDLVLAKGALLLMRPLLVHASTQARVPQHRRVLHLELAPREIISPLQWQAEIQLRRAA